MAFSRVAIQGRYDYNQWVTSFTFSYSLDGKNWVTYKENGRDKVMYTHNTHSRTQIRKVEESRYLTHMQKYMHTIKESERDKVPLMYESNPRVPIPPGQSPGI